MNFNPIDRRKFLALGAVATLLPERAGGAQTDGLPESLTAVRRQALAYVAEGQVPSVSVAVYQHGRPIWVEAFGWANRETRTVATVETRYAIASVTKPFTATALVSLLTHHQISLDDPVERHLGPFRTDAPSDAAPVTFRELLQHRSGIPKHWRNVYPGQGELASFAEVVQTHAFTTAARGRRYLYSNLNYGLLAAVIEQITQSDFHAHLREVLLQPLGLTSATTFAQPPGAGTTAVPYEEDGTPVPPHLVDEKGARDLIMTAQDLARFGDAHLSGHAAIRDEVRREMLSERAAITTTEVARPFYGLGWIIEEDSPAGLFSYGHTGEGSGAAASLTVLPGEQLVVATLANAQGAPAYRLNEMIVDAISPEFAARRAAHPYVDPEPDAADLAPFLGDWTGQLITAQGPVEVRLAIQGEDDSSILIGTGPSAPLRRLAVDQAVFSARSEVSLPGIDADRWPHTTRLHLDLADHGLDGSAAAYAPRTPPDVAHDQFWLSYRLRLSRA